MPQNLEDISLVSWAKRFIYVMTLWVVPGVYSCFAGGMALWILSDRLSSPLWLEVTLKFVAFIPVFYVVFGVWTYVFTDSPKGRNREPSGRKRLVLLWIVPLLLLASQIVIMIFYWDP